MTRPAWQQLGPLGAFYECPRWHDGRWWVSDFYDDRVVTLDEDGGSEVVLTLHEDHPGGLGWLPDGSLLVVEMLAQRIRRVAPDGISTLHADLAAYCGGPANDMVVAADGTAYVGNFGFDLNGGEEFVPADLLRVRPDGSVHVAASELWFPNGSVITDGGRTLIVGETFASRHSAFTIEPDGSLTDRRTWAQVAPTTAVAPVAEMVAQVDYAPDGCAIDAAGHLWVADSLHQRCVRIDDTGTILEQLDLPGGLSAFACALGGPDGRTLLVTAAPDFNPEARRVAPESVLLTHRVSTAA
ncbi:SMP-30/gluconolactonase/LRE family protein [Aeromicrobium ginsengisoli]|uniref:SMP-30/gluconolactonase/LRE family protein n=1 Tax=Aeromicrobium ginsengisoli TaxID=363867 RepID=A0A5M4FKJ9_9ACTN|nr:SMP-30/gluconolactonase/LRE family protein [Aeromicrobium ginsengisoli]KAA1400253.1 SMP-30/gluconolactonase/LRE family protein [Aeromicrobium ginsengisoli]